MFVSLIVDRGNCKAVSGNTFEQRPTSAAAE